MTTETEATASTNSSTVRERLVEALKLDLVGPWAGHELAEERLPARERPSSWYLTGFLIPSGTPPERSGDADEDDDFGGEVPGSAGLHGPNLAVCWTSPMQPVRPVLRHR